MEGFLTYLSNVVVVTALHMFLLIGVGLILGVLINFLSRTLRTYAGSIFPPRLFAYLLAPGVVLHELAHWFFLAIFGYQIRKKRLFQYKRDDPRLGYVQPGPPRGYFQRVGGFFASVGPIAVGALVIYILSVHLLGTGLFEGVSFTVTTDAGLNLLDALGRLVESIFLNTEQILLRLIAVQDIPGWHVALFLYLTFAIVNAMELSREDLKFAQPGFLLLVGGVFLINLLTVWVGGDLIGLLFVLLRRPLSSLYAMMVFVLCLDALLALIVVPLGVVFGRGMR